MRIAALVAIATIALTPVGRDVVAEGPPAPPTGLILEMEPHFRGPSPHMFNFRWLVTTAAAGYGWEVERGLSNSAGPVAFVPWQTIAPGLAFPGDFANVIDDETPVGVRACYRVRAVARSRPSSDWSATACGDLLHLPPPLQMAVSATVLPDGVSLSWQPQPGADLGYWPQMAMSHPDGLRDWLGIDIIPAGQARLSVVAPVASAPARWCFRVFPISSSAVVLAPSEETCLDYLGAGAAPSPARTVTPTPPATGSGSVPRDPFRSIGASAIVVFLTGISVLLARRG